MDYQEKVLLGLEEIEEPTEELLIALSKYLEDHTTTMGKAAAFLGVTTTSVAATLSRGKLSRFKFQGNWLLPKIKVVHYRNTRRNQGPPRSSVPISTL